MHLYQQSEHVSCFSLIIKNVGSYTKLSIYKAKNRSDSSTTNSALQILENSGFKLTYSIVVKSDFVTYSADKPSVSHRPWLCKAGNSILLFFRKTPETTIIWKTSMPLTRKSKSFLIYFSSNIPFNLPTNVAMENGF